MFEAEKKGYIGHPGQLVRLRRVTVAEGKAKGTEIIEVSTAAGLELDILPDAGLDIGQARYKGVNVAWMCKNGYDSPAVIAPVESEFNNTFPGGLLYTCGLRNAGPPNRDGQEWHPLHGRYHGIAADQVCARMTDDEVIVSGVIRESALFAHCLEVKRTIRIPCFGTTISIEDEVSNLTPRPEEYMHIYHCNFGYPLISEDAELELPAGVKTIPRTEFAAEGMGKMTTFETPLDYEDERVFYHLTKEDFSVRLKNPRLGINMEMTWSADTLPILAEWRCMSSGDYVLALEPTNCYIKGRKLERENGTLQKLEAFETRKNKVTISFS